MKKFKQFRAEQQYITEVGPFASAMMAAMGLVGLGVGGYKLFKKAKEGIKGYRESKADESFHERVVKNLEPKIPMAFVADKDMAKTVERSLEKVKKQ